MLVKKQRSCKVLLNYGSSIIETKNKEIKHNHVCLVLPTSYSH